MQGLAKLMILGAVLAFAIAVIQALFLGGVLMGMPAESFSRASTNMALFAIGIAVCFKDHGSASAGE